MTNHKIEKPYPPLESRKAHNTYEVTISKEDLQKQRGVLSLLLIVCILLLSFSYYRVNQLEEQLHHKEADYKMLLKICSEQR